jgi:hypothetical protein
MRIKVLNASGMSIGLQSGQYYRLNPGETEIHPDFEEELRVNPSIQYLEAVGDIEIKDGSVDPIEHNVGMSVDKKDGVPVSVPDAVTDVEVTSKVVPSSKKSALSKKRSPDSAPQVAAHGESKTPIADLDFTVG